ncbi:hypothetical protein [Paenibacillus dauci]|uniref:hypothetical protein n=1 Tax=Paenibacillus dauci TaxID=1567106 RepID=UPI000697B8FD|nr:hypothetical protein [Paenibacillus dauci]
MRDSGRDLTIEAVDTTGVTQYDIASATRGGTRRLMVSDNPETLSESTFPVRQGTLWHDVVRSSGSIITHRVFGWHYNVLTTPVKVGITVENRANHGALRIEEVTREYRIGGDEVNWITDIGGSISRAILAGTTDDRTPNAALIKQQQSGLIEEFIIPPGKLLGFTYDFTVKSTDSGEMLYTVRTAASRDTAYDLTLIKSAPLPPAPQAHPRGNWTFSETNAVTPVYTVGTARAIYPTAAKLKKDGSLPVDQLFTAAASELPELPLDNRAQFGVIYNVTVPVYNPGSQKKTIQISLNPRGGSYGGAVRMNDTVYGVPLMRTNKEKAPVYVASVPPGNSKYTFSLMIAGASSTPLGILLETL